MPWPGHILTTLNRGLIFFGYSSVFAYYKKAQPDDCCEINYWKNKHETKKVQ